MKSIILGLLILFSLTLSAQVQLVQTSKLNLTYSGGYWAAYEKDIWQMNYIKNSDLSEGKFNFHIDLTGEVMYTYVYYFSTKTFDNDPDFDFILYVQSSAGSYAKIYHQDGTVLYDFKSAISQSQFYISTSTDSCIVITSNAGPIKYYFFKIPGKIEDIMENDESLLKLYPNPVSNLLNIDVSPGGTLQIFDFFGNLIRSEPYNTQSIDMSKLFPGEYLLKITQNNEIISGRFIKM